MFKKKWELDYISLSLIFYEDFVNSRSCNPLVNLTEFTELGVAQK